MWFRGLLRYRLIKCLDVGVVDEFFFLLWHGICLIGIFAGFDSLDNPDGVEFREFDPPSKFWVQGTPDRTKFEECGCCQESICCLPFWWLDIGSSNNHLESLPCDFVGIHSGLSTTEDLQSELLDIGARRNSVRDCIIVWVFYFELFDANIISC
jgi:hypothetical protein